MFNKKHHDQKKPSSKPSSEAVSAADNLGSNAGDNVALPEVHTGKVDVPGDFEREQHCDEKQSVVFDTLAVPEFHTGKCEQIDSTTEEKPHHKHGLFSDLARTLVNGTPDD